MFEALTSDVDLVSHALVAFVTCAVAILSGTLVLLWRRPEVLDALTPLEPEAAVARH